MKVSIVTISFNQGAFLEEAINSVLSQQDAAIEYIVVDPGSTDNSREIIRRYADRIAQVILTPDKGPADGLNVGFSRATGEILGFLNADDYLLPNAIKTVVRHFQQHACSDVVSGHAAIVDKNSKKLRLGYSEPFNLRRYAFGASITMQPSTFFRRQALTKSGGFNIENRSNWDGELWVAMSQNGCQFDILNQILSAYRLQPESITASGRLSTSIALYHERIFERIMQRKRRPLDVVEAMFWRVYKHLRGPRALWERIVRGPIYRRTC